MRRLLAVAVSCMTACGSPLADEHGEAFGIHMLGWTQVPAPPTCGIPFPTYGARSAIFRVAEFAQDAAGWVFWVSPPRVSAYDDRWVRPPDSLQGDTAKWSGNGQLELELTPDHSYWLDRLGVVATGAVSPAHLAVDSPEGHLVVKYTVTGTPYEWTLTKGALMVARIQTAGGATGGPYSGVVFESNCARRPTTWSIFEYWHDIHGGDAAEQVRARVSYQGDAGRYDISLSGGDLTAPGWVKYCWYGFQTQYYEDSLGLHPTEGAESACDVPMAFIP